MPVKYYSVPSDFKKSTIDAFDKLNKKYADSKITEVYGQITGENGWGSGRSADSVPEADMESLKAYSYYAGSKRIQFNYTLNATCMGNDEFVEKRAQDLYSFLRGIHAAGISSLTISMPSVIELVKSMNLDFKIKASVLSCITNVSKALSYKSLKVDKIVIDESINRQFSVIKDIREAFGPAVEMIVNVVCLKNCVYRPFHYNQMSHDISSGRKGITYYSHRCLLKRMENPGNIMRMNWVRPEDIRYYSDIGIQYFKIQGRQAAINGDIARVLDNYMNEEYDGGLLDLLDSFLPTSSFHPYIPNGKLDGFILPFTESAGFCINHCEKCGYCNRFIAERIDAEEITRLYGMGEMFIKEIDQYIKQWGGLQ